MANAWNSQENLIVRRLGIVPYQPVWRAMQTFTGQRDDATFDEVWLLQHQPVFTLGQAGKTEHILAAGRIPVVTTDRGGQVTYHGPGQLVAYLLLQLSRLKLGVRDLVTLIEQTLVDTLSNYRLAAHVKADAPGVYIADKKIASLGLRVRRGACYHGMALNIDMDMEPFKRINPCGYAGLDMVQLTDFDQSAKLNDVTRRWLGYFSSRLGYQKLTEKTGLPNVGKNHSAHFT